MRAGLEAPNCFPTGRHYPGIAERIARSVQSVEGLAEDFDPATQWSSIPLAVIDFETTGRDKELEASEGAEVDSIARKLRGLLKRAEKVGPKDVGGNLELAAHARDQASAAGDDGANVLLVTFAHPSDRPGSNPDAMGDRDEFVERAK